MADESPPVAAKCCAIWTCLKRLSCWFFRDVAPGVGTLLLGVAAVIASCQTGDVISKVMKIQQTANDISEGVAQVRGGVVELRRAVAGLDSQIKALRAEATIVKNPLLREANPPIQAFIDALASIPTEPKGEGLSVFLPQADREMVVKKMQAVRTPYERELILQRHLQSQFTINPAADSAWAKEKAVGKSK